MAYVLSITNQKGGTGKTTTAMEVAACFADKKLKVLLIDFDQQRNLSKYMGVEESDKNIFTLLTGKIDPADAIQRLNNEQIHNICIIPGSPDMSSADIAFRDSADVYLLVDMIELISKDFDIIIIDNSPARNTLLNMAYVASDGVLFCTESDDGSLDGIDAVIKDIQKYKYGKRSLSHAVVLGAVMTRYEDNLIQAASAEYLEEFFDKMDSGLKSKKLPPFVMTVAKTIKLTEAKAFKSPLQVYSYDSRAAKDYRDISDELLKRMEVK